MAKYADRKDIEYPCGCSVTFIYTYGALAEEPYWQGVAVRFCTPHDDEED